MKSIAFTLLAVTLAAGLGAPAQAQTIERPGDRFRSPQRWALELRLGPYRPEIDSEFKGERTPHETYFGAKSKLMFQTELDYQFLRLFGTLAVSAQVGYLSQTGEALTAAGGESGDETALTMVPTALQLVYRMDEAARRWGIPIAPYAKAGLSYTLWRVTNAEGDVARMGGLKARGGTPGWQAAAGVALLLDFIDQASARALDSETGLNHTYVFFEVARYEASGFGASKALRLGDSTWSAGLMFEF